MNHRRLPPQAGKLSGGEEALQRATWGRVVLLHTCELSILKTYMNTNIKRVKP